MDETLPRPTTPADSSSDHEDEDSLFGNSDPEPSSASVKPAHTHIAPEYDISGLHFNPSLCIPSATSVALLQAIKVHDYFRGGQINQVMLFVPSPDVQGSNTSLPSFLLDLITVLEDILRDNIPLSTHQLLFPGNAHPCARQAILNLYRPGEGISPHVDLVNRFGDGIIIVSLGSGTVMQLANTQDGRALDLWLGPGSILVLEGEARYDWSHSIACRDSDLVKDPDFGNSWISRDVRVSITLRWMLPGADVVGGLEQASHRT